MSIEKKSLISSRTAAKKAVIARAAAQPKSAALKAKAAPKKSIEATMKPLGVNAPFCTKL